MELTKQQLEKIQANNLELIDNFEEFYLNGIELNIEKCYLFKTAENKFWQATSKHNIFYCVQNLEYWNELKRIATLNNASRLKAQQQNIDEKNNSDKIDAFLIGIFGNNLPAKKKISTIKKYLNKYVLLAYVNGKKGIQGVTAEKAFFNTLAWTEFYLFVTSDVN